MKLGIITSALALAALIFTGCRKNEEPHDIYNEIKSVNRLNLAGMTISKMATIDDITLDEAKGVKETADALLNAIKIGDRIAVYSYDTYLRAYIDLSELTPSDVAVDESTRSVTLLLPAIKTEFAGRDLPIRENHYRVTGLRSAINAKERAAIKERMNESLKAEVRRNPQFQNHVKSEARRKAVAYFESMLGNLGYSADISFKSK
ncbi:DUF4230 domain-containing protein [Barnesiella sp. WM24]|uniref:DUF4230 domain-containing protein n=1 Tax=Barnesiella sp. WM24 TaxID=2558278 RepID=UPI001071BEC7|nr:DUF4230 domain-containing protein [Barnesiella sp. WM24]MDE6114969.1 DUF4230 domain-containing protein [Muribaculum sp.]TFU93768.1 DUF4230 domain-containing protein [Barnesiella sp. WM24]